VAIVISPAATAVAQDRPIAMPSAIFFVKFIVILPD
jgi:hypothetical protein